MKKHDQHGKVEMEMVVQILGVYVEGHVQDEEQARVPADRGHLSLALPAHPSAKYAVICARPLMPNGK